MGFEVGQIVGDYEILDTLGSGGMGQVYRVRNVISNRIEAMKALRSSMTAEPDFAARFSAEIRTLAGFDHPNIAQLRTAFQTDGQQLMVMEFVEGSTLDELARHGTLPLKDVLTITGQILSALSYAHGRGVIHRDIKPANIMVTAQGVVKLMDFGIAKSASENHLTQPGSTIGSFYYISPEQVRGVPVDARSDIYSVGILLYELLSGRRPFQADTTFALLNQQLNEAPEPLVAVNPKVPQVLNDLVLMAMSKEPAQRFQTADAFAKAIRSIADHTTAAISIVSRPAVESISQPLPAQPYPGGVSPAPAPPSPAPRPAPQASYPQPHLTPPPAKPNRTLWVLGGALAVVAVFVAALFLAPRWWSTRASSKRDNVQTVSETATAAAKPPAEVMQPTVPEHPQPIDSGVQAPPPTEPSSVPVASKLLPPASIRGKNLRTANTPSVPSGPRPAVYPSVQPPAVEPPQAEQQPQQPAGPSDEDVEKIQDELIKVNSRASAVAGSVERLQQQQAADGLGLRQDMSGAYSRMNSYLHAADSDVASRNLAAARRHIDMAEKEISTLENFFHK